MRRHLPTFTSLLCFDASARHLNFTRAAEELNLTQSAVSRQVRNLEEFVQCDLFKRIKKRLVLSREGENYARAISDHLNALEAETLKLITNTQDDSRLNLATFPTFGSRWLIPHLPDFTKKNPDIQYNLITGLKAFDFSTQEIDVAIQHGDGHWRDVVCEKIIDETVVAVCSPALLETNSYPVPEDVLTFPLLHLQTRQYAWAEWLEAQNITPKSSLNGPVFETFSMMIRAARTGLGVAIVPLMYIRDELDNRQLISPFGAAIKSQRGYYLVSTEQKMKLKKVQTFINWINQIKAATVL